MNADEIYAKLIEKLELKKDERMAVDYTPCLGDFYSLCSAVQYAENTLQKEYVLLYFSDRQQEIIDWFSYDGYSINCYRMSQEDYNVLHSASNEIKSKYRDYFVSWSFGDADFRNLTQNVSPEYAAELRDPRFPSVNIIEKYSEYIQPQKTVLIIPEAVTVASPPLWFWNFSAQLFRYLGYSVIFNAAPEKSKLYNGKCMFVPLSEMSGFADACGVVFGVRTGLFDILRTSSAQMVILSTKRYAPLDKVFHIPNTSERIKTVFYENNDPFFKKSRIIDVVERHYNNADKAIKQLLKELGKNEFINCNSSNFQIADIIKSYGVATWCNKYTGSPFLEVPSFAEPTFSNEIHDNKIVFCIHDLSPNDYRFDYIVYLNDYQLMTLDDMQSNYLLFPLKQTGEYYIKAVITDLSSYKQEYFESDHLFYTPPVPDTFNRLISCDDLYTYVTALERFASHITIYISSRDSHTHFGKNKNTQMLHILRILGLKTDFEATCRHSFIGIIDGGNVIEELLSADKTLSCQCEIDCNSICIESSGFNTAHTDKTPIKIEINGENLAINKRGLNIVVWDKKSNTLIDSVVFDTFAGNFASRESSQIAENAMKHYLPSQTINTTKSTLLEQAKTLGEILKTAKELENRNACLKKEIADLKNSVAKKHMLQDELVVLTSANRELTQNKTQLEDERRCLLSEIDQLNAEISELNSLTSKSANEVYELKLLNRDLEKQVAGYANSRSWHITKPLRSIAGFFRKLLGKK